MLRKKKILTAALCAGGVVLSAALTAAETTIVSQPFAKATTDLKQLGGENPGSWTGYGSVTNQTVGYTKPTGVGSPINTAEDKLYLSVEGQVTCTAATVADKPATVDMMFQIAKPDEALALPSGETTSDIQIALGVDTDGTLKAYCKNRADVTAWYALGTKQYVEGAWHRVSFTFDYGHKTCQIRLDGEPLMTANGYLTSDPNGATADTGSWYKLNTTTVQKISSLKVVGSTAIDEVVVKYGEGLGEVQPPLADGNDKTGEVPNAWLAEQGITREMATGNAPDGSNMTVADKYKAGFTVADGKKLEITKMAVKAGGVELKVPVAQSPNGYKNVIEVKNGEKIVETKVIESGTDTVTAVVPNVGENGKAVKFTYQIKTQTK